MFGVLCGQVGHSRGDFLRTTYLKIPHSIESYRFCTPFGYILPLVESISKGLAKLHVFAPHPTRRDSSFVPHELASPRLVLKERSDYKNRSTPVVRLGSNPTSLSQNTIDQHIRVGLIVLRRGRDSNPRRVLPLGGFQDRCNQPLCHPSSFILL